MWNEKYENLVDLLFMKTNRKEIEWTSDSDLELHCDFGQHYLWVGKRNHRKDSALYLRITDWTGEEIDTIDDDELTPECSAKMAILIKVAQRQARGADKAIEDILSMLKAEDD